MYTFVDITWNLTDMKRMYRILAVLLIGFAGGALSPWVLSWIMPVPISSPDDAISIANTFIVFTTIFFVGITVILAVAGYVFTEQFSATKETQEIKALNELKEKIRSTEQTSNDLLDALLANPDTKRHFENQIQSKIDLFITERLSDSQAFCDQANFENNAVQKIAEQLSQNKRGDNK